MAERPIIRRKKVRFIPSSDYIRKEAAKLKEIEEDLERIPFQKQTEYTWSIYIVMMNINLLLLFTFIHDKTVELIGAFVDEEDVFLWGYSL